MTETASELIQTLKRYIYESDERINDLEKKIEELMNIDVAILEAATRTNKHN